MGVADIEFEENVAANGAAKIYGGGVGTQIFKSVEPFRIMVDMARL